MSDTTQHEFKAEVRKVLNIITHSLYTNREIFLRELVSNASDALDKLRFLQNNGQSPRAPELPLEIQIKIDSDAKTLTITDTGVGMTKEDLANNLGTIAKSGSEQFLADISKDAENKDASNIIGRFGIGFYAVFMVADKVEVSSRPAFEDAQGYVWESDGSGTFSISPTDNAPERGTVIVAHIKDDAADFLEKYRLESIIRTHSAFIPFSISVDGEHINTTPALWREPKFSITKEQYTEFYKFLSYDPSEPLDNIHLSVDAPVQFNALLFIPEHTQDFFGMGRDHWGLDLYARRVLIGRENKELLPEYLSFLKGVVDTEDLPLNISRETLQENIVLRKIQQTIVKQSLSHLEKMTIADQDKYNKFWKAHGQVFKLGYQDFVNKDRIATLLRFNSSFHEDAEGLTSFDEYMSRAKSGQKTLWYVSGASREAARLNPHLEVFRKKGLEVLYLTETVDEFALEGLHTYKEWEFKSVERADHEALKEFKDQEDDSPKATPLAQEDQDNFEALIKDMKEILGDKVIDVRVSQRLADSPACLVSPDGSTSSMEKFMRVMQKDDSMPKKVLEVNQDHPMLRTLLRIHKKNAKDNLLTEMVQGLFDTSLLLDGYIKDTFALAARTNKLMEQAGAWYAELKQI